jgi:hypothetical protein
VSEPQSAEAVRAGDRACGPVSIEPTPDGFLVPPENDLTVRKLIDSNPADGQDCQASHCPPSAYQDCDWPRCAGEQP